MGYLVNELNVLTEAQRLNAILIMEGMPEELPLLVDSPDYVFSHDRVDDTDSTIPYKEQQVAYSLDECTPVDTFINSQAEPEYRYKENN